MNISGLKDVIIEYIEDVREHTALYISLPKKPHACPNYGARTAKVLLNIKYKEIDNPLG